MDIIDSIFALCKEKKAVISVCESLTGGLISCLLIERAGASEFFYEGITAYSNQSKVERLSVDPETLKTYGAVSAEVAAEMAAGLLKGGQISVAVSTTGIAGPGGGSEKKPVGLVYIGVADGRKALAYKFLFGGERNEIRKKTAEEALKIMEKALLGL